MISQIKVCFKVSLLSLCKLFPPLFCFFSLSLNSFFFFFFLLSSLHSLISILFLFEDLSSTELVGGGCCWIVMLSYASVPHWEVLQTYSHERAIFPAAAHHAAEKCGKMEMWSNVPATLQNGFRQFCRIPTNPSGWGREGSDWNFFSFPFSFFFWVAVEGGGGVLWSLTEIIQA